MNPLELNAIGSREWFIVAYLSLSVRHSKFSVFKNRTNSQVPVRLDQVFFYSYSFDQWLWHVFQIVNKRMGQCIFVEIIIVRFYKMEISIVSKYSRSVIDLWSKSSSLHYILSNSVVLNHKLWSKVQEDLIKIKVRSSNIHKRRFILILLIENFRWKFASTFGDNNSFRFTYRRLK